MQLKFPRTTLNAASGVLRYDDDDPPAHNRREVYYYYVEGTQKIYRGLYGAARWSQVFADRGFRIASQLGARQTVSKPFSRQEILDAVREALAAESDPDKSWSR